MSGEQISEAFRDLIWREVSEGAKPDRILCGGWQAAILNTAAIFADRDWRRQKREMRKAEKRWRDSRRSTG